MSPLVIGSVKWRLPGTTCIAIVSCFVSDRFLLHFRCELSGSFVFDMGWNLQWGCEERRVFWYFPACCLHIRHV